MKKQTQILTLAIGSLVTAVLVAYVIITLLTGDQSSVQSSRLAEIYSSHLDSARAAYSKKKGGDESIDMEKAVVGPVTAAHDLLVAVRDGKPTPAGIFEMQDSESSKEKFKLAIFATERLQEQIKAGSDKVEALFNESSSYGKAVVDIYIEGAASQIAMFRALAWITIAVTVIFCVLVVLYTFNAIRRYESQLTAAQTKVHDEGVRVNQLSKFIEGMANGNYDMEIETSKEDELTATLVSMREKLRNNAVEEQRRNWSTTGLANIGEILRSSGNAAELYDSIVKFVVKYTNSNQGGLFILDDVDVNNQALELMACYAFERKKFLTKRIEIGQGLVGQCFLEKEKIHLTEIPDDYVRITSGLGGDRPNSCLLMPLKVNEKVFGVIELASFHFYPEHVVDLVAKFAESIASTIANVKTNESTRVLLEQTQQQAEQMKSQEEEMRQNMEELSATQEEMHRKEREYINRIRELELQVGEKV